MELCIGWLENTNMEGCWRLTKILRLFAQLIVIPKIHIQIVIQLFQNKTRGREMQKSYFRRRQTMVSKKWKQIARKVTFNINNPWSRFNHFSIEINSSLNTWRLIYIFIYIKIAPLLDYYPSYCFFLHDSVKAILKQKSLIFRVCLSYNSSGIMGDRL